MGKSSQVVGKGGSEVANSTVATFNPMRTLPRFRHAFLVMVVAISIVAAPGQAGAEIDPGNQTWWGVDALATGTTTDRITADVWAIEQIDDVVYVGGKFTLVAHETRRFDQPFIAAFDAATGVWIDSWAPRFDGPVYALQASPDGSRLFVGGEFEQVDGNNVKGLVALDPSTGFVDWSWRTRVSGGSPAVVRALDIEGDQLYVGGSFDAVGNNGVRFGASGATRVSVSTGAIDPTWFPAVVGGGTWDLAPSKTTNDVYLTGSFTSIGGEPGTQHVARVDDAGNVAGTWRYELNHDYPEWAQAVETTPSGLVFIGGSQHVLNAYDEATMTIQWSHFTNPSGGDFQAIEFDEATGRVYASCHCFNQHYSRNDGGVNQIRRGQPNPRLGIVSDIDWVMAYDGATGEKIDSFVPDFSGTAGPWALHTSPNGCLWVGGGISATSGTSQKSLTKICDPARLDDERPTTPRTLLASNPTDSTVDLTWTGSTDNVGVTLYEVYDEATGRVLATSATPSVQVVGLAPGTVSLFVKARDADGNRSWRTNLETVTLSGNDTVRPTTPRALNGIARGAGTVDLAWIASTDNVGVVGYELFDPVSGQLVLTTTATTATIPEQANTDVAVRAVDAAGNTSWRSNTQPR